ncbi:hypothetical protein [Nitrosomonas communis]|nr:hypothetical protein [Nitrosomonas communis]
MESSTIFTDEELMSTPSSRGDLAGKKFKLTAKPLLNIDLLETIF